MALPDPQALWRAAPSPASPAPVDWGLLSSCPLLTRHTGITNGAAAATYQQHGCRPNAQREMLLVVGIMGNFWPFEAKKN